VETPDHDRHARRPQRARNVESAGILIRLDADQRDEAEIALGAKSGDDPRDIYPRIRLVDSVDVDRDRASQNPTFRAIRGDAVQSRQRIRRNDRSPPADDVTIVVVMRGFDEKKGKTPFRGHVAPFGQQERETIMKRNPFTASPRLIRWRGGRRRCAAVGLSRAKTKLAH
jgi:hypothetical protein